MQGDTYHHARELFLAGDSLSAVELLQSALQADSDDGGCWELLGIIRHGQRSYADAMAAFESATLLKPLSLSGQLALADCYSKLKYFESARCVYLHLAQHPTLPTQYLPDVARGLAGAGDYRGALEACRRAVEHHPDCDQATFGLAYYMGKCGYPKEVILPVLRKAVELSPEVVRYRVALATTYQELGHDEAAIHLLGRLTLKQLRDIGCVNCLRRIANVFEAAGDKLRHAACISRLEELTSN